MLYEHFRNGMNLGGWLSQYDCLTAPPQNQEQMAAHLASYLTEKNIAQIAAWGFDHVRLPVDYRVLEKTDESLTDLTAALACLDQCVLWCEKYQLNLIIDLHNAAGNCYGMMDRPMPLLTEEPLRQRFIAIWRLLTNYFRGRNSPVILFELLNEVSDGSGFLWNRLYKETVRAIRALDPGRWILIGSNEQNSPFCLKELDLLDDPYVFYNFHFYDPQAFTHQQAHFSEEMMLFHRKIHYPGSLSGFTDFLCTHPQFLPKYRHVAMEQEVSTESMKQLLKDAFDFVRYSGKELYCGEYGVIASADDDDAAAWIHDLRTILDANRIGHAMWNYKEMDFGLVDLKNQITSQKRLECLMVHPLDSFF